MKTLIIIGLLINSFSAFAVLGKDKAVGSCSLQLKRNKTKFKNLRRSKAEYSNIEIKGLNRYPMYEDIKRVYVDPNNMGSIHENTILLFESDTEKLNDIENPTYVTLQDRKGDIEIEYVPKGATFRTGRSYSRVITGPALRIHHTDAQGNLHEKIEQLHDGESKFTYKDTIKVRRTRFKKNDETGRYEAVETYQQNRKMKLKCTFKVVEEEETPPPAAPAEPSTPYPRTFDADAIREG